MKRSINRTGDHWRYAQPVNIHILGAATLVNGDASTGTSFVDAIELIPARTQDALRNPGQR